MKQPFSKLFLGASSLFLCSAVIASPSFDTLRAHAPADTPMYYEGDIVINAPGLSSFNSSDEDMRQLFRSIFSDPSAADFVSQLAADFTDFSQGNDPALLKEYGFSTEDKSALYLDAGLPVLQITSDQPQTFIDKVIAVAKESLFDAQRESWKGLDVYTWPLEIEGFEGETPYLAVSKSNETVSLGFVFESDSLDQKLARLGLLEEPISLNKTGKLSDLKSRFNFQGNNVGFLDIEQLALMFSSSQEHSGFSAVQKLGMTPIIDSSCKDDALMLAQSAPLLATNVLITNENGEDGVEYKTIWEIKNTDVKDGLQQLSGHLSPTTLTKSDAILSLGMGIDVNQLIPVLTKFWMQFQSLELTCPGLKTLQTELKAKHPSQLAMFAGLAHGVKGLSFDLFSFDTTSEGFRSIDAILSIFADNPRNLAAIAANVAPIKGLPLPTDGSPADLEIPDVPPTINIKGRTKGNALMIYSGEQAAALSETKSQEELNQKGLLALDVDYSDSVTLFDKMVEGSATQSVESCIIGHQEFQKLSNQNATSTMAVSFNSIGAEIDVFASATRAKTVTSPIGSYVVETMGDDCSWTSYGYETINPNGTGSYRVVDDIEPDCDLFQVNYQWKQEGSQFVVNEQKVLGRESCDIELQEQAPSNYQCTLLPTGKQGFECLLDEASLYRYRPK